ncbi:MAG: CapA family protein [Acidimicrobiia bacterium]|nr:CapA family protein [Acidimicrobiia bacterium]
MRRLAAPVAVVIVLLFGAVPAPASEPRSFTIAAGGDILIHDMVMDAARRYAGYDGFDFGPMLDPIEPWISTADLAICHLEGTLSPTNTSLGGWPRFNAPHEVAAALAETGYDICSTSGNHAVDRGWTGLVETLDVLDAHGIDHDGTARTEDERLPSLHRVNGVRVAHLSYSYGLNGLPIPQGRPWSVNVIDEDRIRADAAWAREHGAEFVIASLHWGVEQHVPPTGAQERLARSLLEDSDVDLILGTHAHVIQPIDRIGDKVVVYGMGNQLSNQFTRWGLPEYYATEDGVIVHLTVSEVGGRFRVTDVAYTPTTVEWATYRVMPSDHTLATGGGTDLWNVEASRTRTVERITLLDVTDVSTTPTAWPAASCGGLPATIVGTDGDDVLVGTPGPDVIAARGGNDVVWGLGGDDVLCGGPGSDLVIGGAGDDVVDPGTVRITPQSRAGLR